MLTRGFPPCYNKRQEGMTLVVSFSPLLQEPPASSRWMAALSYLSFLQKLKTANTSMIIIMNVDNIS